MNAAVQIPLKRDAHGHVFCEHKRKRSQCVECRGSQTCEHSRVRSHCIECGGNQTCEHKRQRSYCIECGGSQICEHKRVRKQCKECGGFEVLANVIWINAKRRAEKKGLLFDITVKDVFDLIGDGTCPVFETPYALNLRRQGGASASLDKLFPELGYIKGNCFVISELANRIKTDASAEQVERVADWMNQQQRILEGEVMIVGRFNGSDFEEISNPFEIFEKQ